MTPEDAKFFLLASDEEVDRYLSENGGDPEWSAWRCAAPSTDAFLAENR
jgi:hypothetical protein